MPKLCNQPPPPGFPPASQRLLEGARRCVWWGISVRQLKTLTLPGLVLLLRTWLGVHPSSVFLIPPFCFSAFTFGCYIFIRCHVAVLPCRRPSASLSLCSNQPQDSAPEAGGT